MAPRLYEAAGMSPEDIDVAEFYDAFSSLVPLQLEAYGFCEPGAAASMIAAGGDEDRWSASGQHPWWSSVRGIRARSQPCRRGGTAAAPRMR